jgi:murein DD-endopeptidase MepM/ murein hydrolase activator NlpD
MKRREFLGALAGAIAGQAKENNAPQNVANSTPEWQNLPPEKQAPLWKDHALALIASKNFAEFPSNPYLMACFYYSDGFLNYNSRLPNNPDITNKLIADITPKVDKALKFEYISFLNRQMPQGQQEKMSLPLKELNFGKGINHQDAVDLFIAEGSPIMAISGGIVLLSESNWAPNKPMSTSSNKGGNSVVIYSPATACFYRYCHLAETTVKVGQKIPAGTEIGKVGHTGQSASLPGHGQHLHLDINRVNIPGLKIESQNVLTLAQILNKIKKDQINS